MGVCALVEVRGVPFFGTQVSFSKLALQQTKQKHDGWQKAIDTIGRQ